VGANLNCAKVSECELEVATLLGTHLENANIDGANFANTSWLTKIRFMILVGCPPFVRVKKLTSPPRTE
jgi:uncharacterized protein YjbI with pentapeptide repeats